jgi:predicted amidohydrolase
MRVGYLQFDPLFGETKRNLDFVCTRLEKAECDLLVLPELFATGYQFVTKSEVQSLAEPVPDGLTCQRLMEVARAHSLHLVAGLPERNGGHCYNSAIVIGPKGFIGLYRKTHLFFEETLFFAPGDTGFRVWEAAGAKIGVMICFDWLYPEAARTLALRGAEIVCHPSNLVLPHCPDAMVTRCLENRMFSVTANRIGAEERGGKERLTYLGQSEIVTPRGRILHRAPSDREELMVLDIDPTEARNKALNRYNDLLRDRRKELYDS